MPSTLHPLTSLTAAGCTAVITTAAGYWPLSLAVAFAAAVLAGARRRRPPRAGRGGGDPAAPGVVAADAARAVLPGGPHRPGGSGGPPGSRRKGWPSPWSRAPVRAPACWSCCSSPSPSAPPISSPRWRRAGLPPQFGFVLASTLTLLPAMAGRLEAGSGQAQEARGLVVRRRTAVPARRATAADGPAGAGPDRGLRKPGPGPRRPRLRQPGSPDQLPGARRPARPAPVPGAACCCSPRPPWHSGSCTSWPAAGLL